VLLTGAAGFIGSHTAEALLRHGYRVVGLDNVNDYYAPERKRSNLREIAQADEANAFQFVEGDIRDRNLAAQLFSQHQFGSVVHLAGMAGVRASIDDPQLYFDVNVNGTLNLLEAARTHRVANFILASTSSVYGDTKVQPFVEDDRCDHPLSQYSATKRAAEMLGFTYHHLYGQSFTALRFFTVYGPRCRPDMMAYKVLNNIFFGEHVPLYEGGNMKRDWTYVSDIVQGVVGALEKPLGYEVINLGCGEKIVLSDFVSKIEQLVGRKANLTITPKLGADVLETSADISKARRLVGYDPQVSVSEGIEKLWHWYRRSVLGNP
jgi:UDP-glucuronate 4-epimerase